MDLKENKRRLLKRISYVIGHLQGVYRMVDDERSCIEVVRQMQAVKASIDRINELILTGHLKGCISSAIEGRGKEARKKVLGEILSVFKTR